MTIRAAAMKIREWLKTNRPDWKHVVVSVKKGFIVIDNLPMGQDAASIAFFATRKEAELDWKWYSDSRTSL